MSLFNTGSLIRGLPWRPAIAAWQSCGALPGWLTVGLGQASVYIELAPEHNQRHRYLTLSEIERLIDACDHEPTRDAVILAVHTGMRRELFALTQTNIRGDCLSLPDRDAKNREPRLIPILAPMIDSVARLPFALHPPLYVGPLQARLRTGGISGSEISRLAPHDGLASHQRRP